jgi:hypothetical protein
VLNVVGFDQKRAFVIGCPSMDSAASNDFGGGSVAKLVVVFEKPSIDFGWEMRRKVVN